MLQADSKQSTVSIQWVCKQHTAVVLYCMGTSCFE